MNKILKLTFQLIFDIIRVSLIPGILIALFVLQIITFEWFIFGLICICIVYFVIPLIFKYSITIQRLAVFMSFLAFPPKSKLKNPLNFDMFGTRNFYIKVNDPNVKNVKEIKIGVWHILPVQICKSYSKELQLNQKQIDSITKALSNPKYLVNDHQSADVEHNYQVLPKDDDTIRSEFQTINAENEQRFYEKMLQLPNSSIVLYLHGNSSNRGFFHRVQLYKLLRKLGHHVFTFDYRNFGDSDPIPQTEDGCVKDALAVYNYIRSITDNPIFIWGHSLGTAVSTHMLARLNEMNPIEPQPKAVVLESPFTNAMDEARAHFIIKPFKWLLPWYNFMFVKPLYKNDFRFESDMYICKFRQPVLILHAADDCIVPYRLGNRLYNRACNNRESSYGKISFHSFKMTSCYGHALLYRDPSLPKILMTYFDVHKERV